MAADLGLPPPPMQQPPQVAPVQAASPCCDRGWYFEGFLGTTNYNVGKLSTPAFRTGNFTHYSKAFESSGFGGIGVGYKFNHWLRADSTVEYRGKSTFHGLDSYYNSSTDYGTNEYTATMDSWVWLTSLYWDIGCWHGFTPYVGAGLGYAYNTVYGFTDVNTPQLGVAHGATHSEGNLAWAVHAGVSYQVNNRVAIDFAYRYLDLGDAQTGTVTAYDGSSSGPGLKFQNVTSQDMMVKLRWKFGAHQPLYMPVSLK